MRFSQTDSSGKTHLSIVDAEGEALQLEVVYEEAAK